MRSQILATILVAWLSGAAAAEAQVLLKKSWDEAITLDLDNAATKRLASIEDFVAERQWDVVAGLLRQAQTEQGDKLVPIAPGWYMSVTRYCQCRAALLPPAGLTAFRSHADGTISSWLADARRTDDRAAWLRIARRGFATSNGGEAVRRLAEQSFELGEFSLARTWWELLLPPEPALRTAAGLGLLRQPTNTNESEVRAALVLCSIFDGDVSRAERELAAFRRRHDGARGRLGGRDGLLADLLSEQLTRVRGGAPLTSNADAPPEIERLIWSRSLPQPVWAEAVLRSDREPLGAFWPIVADQKLFVTNGEMILGWEFSNGRAAWSAKVKGEGEVDANDEANAAPDKAAIIHAVANPTSPKCPISGRVLQTMTALEDRLYARLGWPITGRAKQEGESPSELVGLDIGVGEGKLVWRVSADDIDPRDQLREWAPWCFEGSPSVTARRVFVGLRRSLPQEEMQIACLDADSGRLVWKRKLGVTIAATNETVNSTSHLRLTLADDSVFVSTDEGAVAALEQSDGTIRWLRTYSDNAATEPRERRRFGSTPPLIHRGVLYVAPLDSQKLMAIHAESGLRMWEREWPDPIQFLLGICDDTLIVSGRSLWGVRLSDGGSAWPLRRVGDDDPEGWAVGRGALIGRHIVWPLRDELLVVAAASGRIARRISLRESFSAQGGDLLVSGSHLFIGHDRQMTVWKLR